MKTLPEKILLEMEEFIEHLKADLSPEEYPEALQELSARVDAALFEYRGEEPDDLKDEEEDDDDDFEFEE